MSCVYCHSLWISLVGALYNRETTKYPNRIAEPIFGIEANQDIYWDFVISTILDTPHSKCLYFPLTSGRSQRIRSWLRSGMQTYTILSNLA